MSYLTSIRTLAPQLKMVWGRSKKRSLAQFDDW